MFALPPPFARKRHAPVDQKMNSQRAILFRSLAESEELDRLEGPPAEAGGR
jgi:hypothetical protein